MELEKKYHKTRKDTRKYLGVGIKTPRRCRRWRGGRLLVSVIIVKYKSEKYLPDCLKSLGRDSRWEMIIVDNDQKNIGYGPACNQGARQAKGKYLFFLNPDTKLTAGCLEKLIRFLENHPQVAIVSPLLLDKNKKPYPLQGTGELTPLRAIFAFSFLDKIWPDNIFSRKYWLKDWDQKKPRLVAVVPGTALMVRRSVFKKINGFDEKFFLYFEESDLCRRVRQAGWQVFFETQAKVIHFWPKRKQRNQALKKIFQSSRFYFFHKHYGILWAWLVEGFLRLAER